MVFFFLFVLRFLQGFATSEDTDKIARKTLKFCCLAKVYYWHCQVSSICGGQVLTDISFH